MLLLKSIKVLSLYNRKNDHYDAAKVKTDEIEIQ